MTDNCCISALATNSNDRVIRVFSLHASPPDQGSDADEDVAMTPPESRPPRVPYFELRHKFQDLVNKTPWNGIGFSRDGEYVIGGECCFDARSCSSVLKS